MTETRLDAAFRAHAEAPERPELWLRFLERVLDAELFLLLAEEAEGARLRPQVFDLAEGRFALAFDQDTRLAAFLDAPAPYAALSGRRLAVVLAGQGTGIGLNLGVAPSATLLPAEAVDWLAAMAGALPVETAGRLSRIAAPRSAPPKLIAALSTKLAAMASLIEAAHLAEAVFEAGGDPGLLLALEGVREAARADVAAAVAEAMRFSGFDAGGLDVTFVAPDAPLRAKLRAVGLGFYLPRPAPDPETQPQAPGSNPARPPILR